MKRFLNTLYITSQKTYLKKEGEAVVVCQDERETKVPFINLDSIVCFGNVTVSPFLLGACAESGISVSFLSEHGRFLARSQGPVAGNVLLRKEQYRISDDEERAALVARTVVAGKVANQRTVLQRALRDHADSVDAEAMRSAVGELARSVDSVQRETSLDAIRGIEGDAARTYFSVFGNMITAQKDGFPFSGRNRRPPLDSVNAMLSFGYTLLYCDIRSALETVGLDPAVGFLHRDRPGRLSLALDIMEEFRAFFIDRLVLSLINKNEVRPGQFEKTASGEVRMDDDARRTFISAYQKKKETELKHPYVGKKMHLAILFQTQAQLLARHIRGDIDGYPVYVWK